MFLNELYKEEMFFFVFVKIFIKTFICIIFFITFVG